MKGNLEVIRTLNGLLKSEQSAMAQYRIHAQMLRNAGYKALKHALHGFFYEENHHSKELLNRILFLGGMPAPEDLVAEPPKFGTEVASIFAADLERELRAVADYNRAVEVAESVKDNGTAKLLRHILAEEEAHAFWLETQLALIKEIGRSAYLSTKLEED